MKRFTTGRAAGFALIAALGSTVACEQTKSASPLSPAIAGPIGGVTITPPAAMSPVNDQKVRDTEQPVLLTFSNADSNSVRPFTLALQMGIDPSFNTGIVYTQLGITPSADGVNRLRLPAKLPAGRVYYWRTKAEDGANASEWGPTASFEVLQPIVIGIPLPLTPAGGIQITNGNPELRARNGSSSGPILNLQYNFQVSTTSSFSNIVTNESVPEGLGDTVLRVPSTPAGQLTMYWRVRMFDAENNVGDWSRVETYRTPAPIATPAPSPSPSPSPSGPCNSSNPESIVVCERNKFSGKMSDGQMLQFMRNVATSLNRNGISPGGFGILRKTGGHNCGGYSCDVICSGNGGGQRQWDVLGDIDGAQDPRWSGPLGTIRVDTCDAP